MIIPGRTVLSRQIIRGLLSEKQQVQPCGIDLSLKRVLRWNSAGIVDFDNKHRKTAATVEIPFERIITRSPSLISSGNAADKGSLKSGEGENELEEHRLHLDPGAYLVEFNETVDTPLDVMGQLFVRSFLFRSGAVITAGVMDSGYQGAIGGMLQVVNPHGLSLYQNAKLAQFVFHELPEKVEGYSGVYQNKKQM